MALPDVREKLAALGYEPITTSPDEFAARIKADIPKWAKAVEHSGLKID